MEEKLDIWVPVISSNLLSCFQSLEQRTYPLHKDFKRIDIIKIKVKSIQTNKRGSKIETILNLEILILLENFIGQIEMLRVEENLRKQFALQQFKYKFDIKGDYQYITQINHLYASGTLQPHSFLGVTINVCFDIMVIQNRRVTLAGDKEIKRAETESPLIMINEGNKVNEKSNDIKSRLENENLLRQLSLYEKDIKSLRRGIQKAEARSFSLKSENREYKDKIAELQTRLKNFEEKLSQDNMNPKEKQYLEKTLVDNNRVINFGQKLKKFLSYLI